MSRFDVRTELRLGEQWVDISGDVYQRDPIEITRGRADEASQVDPGKCKLTINNRGGKYSPRNPMSPYYGTLGRNTPLRVWVGQPDVGEATSAWSSASDHVAPSVAPRVAASLLVCAWAQVGADDDGDYTVPVSMTADDELDGANSVSISATETLAESGETGERTATFSHSGVIIGWAAGATAVPGESGPPVVEEFAAQVTDNDDITLTTSAETQAGDWLLVVHIWAYDSRDDMTQPPGGTRGEWIRVADSEEARNVFPRIRMWMRRVAVAGVQETVFRADPDDNNYQNHARLYRLSNVAFHAPRFAGEVAAWPPRWDLSEQDVYTPIEAAGILRRLGQGAAPIRSPMYRETVSPFKPDPDRRDPQAYWPCEDREGADSIASGLPDGPPMLITGAPDLAAFDGFTASQDVPLMKTGSFTGEVPDYEPTGETQVWWLFHAPDDGAGDGQRLMTLFTGGSAQQWDIIYYSNASLEFRVFNVFGQEIHSSGPWAFNANGRLLWSTLEIFFRSGDLTYRYTHIEAGVEPSDGVVDETIGGGHTIGQIQRVQVAADHELGDMAVGHVSVHDVITGIGTLGPALNAWRDEPAGRRIERLCLEEGIPFVGEGDLDDTAAMGPQGADNVLDILEDAANADGGILHETRDVIGLAYRTRHSMYNQGLPQ